MTETADTTLSPADRAWLAAHAWTPHADVWRQWGVDAARFIGWLAVAPLQALGRVQWTADKVAGLVTLGVPAAALVRWLPHVTWTGWASLRTGLIALGVMAVVALAATAPRPSRSPAAGAQVWCGPRKAAAGGSCACGYSSKSEADMHRHEQAHVNAVRKASGGAASYEVWQNADGTWSGLTTFHDPDRVWSLPAASIVGIYGAGIKAAPSTGSPIDGKVIKQVIRSVPAGERGAVRREGNANIRRWAR